MSAPIQTLALWLEEQCTFVRRLEAEANDELQKQGNEVRYRQLMRQKALFLDTLPDEAADLLKVLPEDKARQVAQRLAAFRRGAENALDLDSVFYMSALLYPDTHKTGDPNNLDLLAEEVKSWG